eukprot:gene16351-19450_t
MVDAIKGSMAPMTDAIKGSMAPMTDAIKGSMAPMTEALKDGFNRLPTMDVERVKEFTEGSIHSMTTLSSSVTSTVTNTVTSTANTVASTVAAPAAHMPSVAQLKESLVDVDLYNGSILLRSYEIKLKQVRVNGALLAERAEELDKRLVPVVRTCHSQAEFWRKAHGELSHLDELNTTVESMHLVLDSIVSKIESLEIDLSLEIDNYLDNELAKYKERKSSDFIKYEAAKKLELITLEENLAGAFTRNKHEKAEREKRNKLEEERLAKKRAEEEAARKLQEEAKMRSTLEKTIQQQLNVYKTTGVVPQVAVPESAPVVSDASSAAVESIEQVVPEDSRDDLEKFLAPTPPTTPTMNSSNSHTTQPPVATTIGSPPDQSPLLSLDIQQVHVKSGLPIDGAMTARESIDAGNTINTFQLAPSQEQRTFLEELLREVKPFTCACGLETSYHHKDVFTHNTTKT